MVRQPRPQSCIKRDLQRRVKQQTTQHTQSLRSSRSRLRRLPLHARPQPHAGAALGDADRGDEVCADIIRVPPCCERPPHGGSHGCASGQPRSASHRLCNDLWLQLMTVSLCDGLIRRMYVERERENSAHERGRAYFARPSRVSQLSLALGHVSLPLITRRSRDRWRQL